MTFNLDEWRRAAQIRYGKRLGGGEKGVFEEAFTGSLKLSMKEVSKFEVLCWQQVEVF